jgi:hypothetical protein
VAGVALSALLAVGIYACLRNLFEAFCYIGGGRITARLGDRGSLMLFGMLTITGYAIFLIVDSPAAAIVATLLIAGWDPLSVPVTFTTVGAMVTKATRHGVRAPVDPEAPAEDRRPGGRWPRARGGHPLPRQLGRRSRRRHAVAGQRGARARLRLAGHPAPLHAAPGTRATRAAHGQSCGAFIRPCVACC